MIDPLDIRRLVALALISSACSSSEPAPNDGGTMTPDGGGGGADASSLDASADVDGSQAPRSCAEIEGAYAAVLKASLICDPNAATDPCTLRASTAPGCGCPLRMNAEKVAEREELSRLTYEYGDAGCDLNACPTSCPLVDDYRCVSRGECAAE